MRPKAEPIGNERRSPGGERRFVFQSCGRNAVPRRPSCRACQTAVLSQCFPEGSCRYGKRCVVSHGETCRSAQLFCQPSRDFCPADGKSYPAGRNPVSRIGIPAGAVGFHDAPPGDVFGRQETPKPPDRSGTGGFVGCDSVVAFRRRPWPGEARDADDDQPVGHGERRDVEHLATDADNDDLPYEDDHGDQAEPAALAQGVESRMPCGERAGIEHVPELEQHEDREEYALLVCREFDAHFAVSGCPGEVGERRDVGLLHHDEQPDEQGGEEHAHADYAAPHGRADDEVFTPARLVAHDVHRGRQRGQRHGSKGVHDQVYPQHLRHSERRLSSHERADEHYEARGYIYCHLEQNKAANVQIKRTSPHHGTRDARKGIVDDCDIARFLGHTGAVAHRQSHLCGL